MTFATSAEIQHFLQDLALLGVRTDVVKARPELEPLIADGPGPSVKLRLPERQDGSWPFVVVGRPHENYSICWLVYGRHRNGAEVEVRWPLDVPGDVLAGSVLAVYDACSTDSPPASPWRWCQPDDNEAVRLADALTVRGLRVSAVLGTYAWAPERPPWPISQTPPRREIGVRVECGWGRVVLTRRPRLGWVLDANVEGDWRRLDLQQLISGTLFSTPGVVDMTPSSMVDAVARACLEAPHMTQADNDDWDTVLLSSTVLENRAVAQRLREMNITATSSDESDGQVIVGNRRIAVINADIDLAWVQRAYAQTLVDHGREGLMIFTSGHVTRGAREWAEKAAVPIFQSWDEFTSVRPLNNLAAEHLPLDL